jgi:hypothetical protein
MVLFYRLGEHTCALVQGSIKLHEIDFLRGGARHGVAVPIRRWADIGGNPPAGFANSRPAGLSDQPDCVIDEPAQKLI